MHQEPRSGGRACATVSNNLLGRIDNRLHVIAVWINDKCSIVRRTVVWT
jgi:hypothetical protein